MIAAILAVLANTAETISDKYIMSREKVGFASFLSIQMFFIALFTLSIYYFYGSVDFSAFNLNYIIMFMAVIGIAYIYNYLYFFGLSHEKVSDVEPIVMFGPLIGIIFASIYYVDERSTLVLVLAIVAAFALVLSHVEKKHLVINNYTAALMGFVVLYAIEALFVKKLLEVFSPVALYGFRTAVLAIIMIAFLRPAFKKIKKKSLFHIAIVGLVVSVQYIALYYAIDNLGLVMTALVFLSAPILIIVSSSIFLKEKISIKKNIASVVILLCIAVAIIYG